MLDHNPETEPEAMVLASEELSTVEAMPTTATEEVTVPEADRVLPCGHTQAQHDAGPAGYARMFLNLAADHFDLHAEQDGWPGDVREQASKWTADEMAVLAQLATAFTTLTPGGVEAAITALVDKGYVQVPLAVRLIEQGGANHPVARVVLNTLMAAMDTEEALGLLGLLIAGANMYGVTADDLRQVQTAWDN